MTPLPKLTPAQARAFHSFTFGSLRPAMISRRTLNVFQDAGLIHRPCRAAWPCWALTDAGRAWLAANPEPSA